MVCFQVSKSLEICIDYRYDSESNKFIGKYKEKFESYLSKAIVRIFKENKNLISANKLTVLVDLNKSYPEFQLMDKTDKSFTIKLNPLKLSEEHENIVEYLRFGIPPSKWHVWRRFYGKGSTFNHFIEHEIRHYLDIKEKGLEIARSDLAINIAEFHRSAGYEGLSKTEFDTAANRYKLYAEQAGATQLVREKIASSLENVNKRISEVESEIRSYEELGATFEAESPARIEELVRLRKAKQSLELEELNVRNQLGELSPTEFVESMSKLMTARSTELASEIRLAERIKNNLLKE